MPHRVIVSRAQALLPLVFEFSVIAAAAALMGVGFAIGLAWERLTELG
ncbi:MAG TPA: hypothetical protein VF169_04910 [Albitalea sp.]